MLDIAIWQVNLEFLFYFVMLTFLFFDRLNVELFELDKVGIFTFMIFPIFGIGSIFKLEEALVGGEVDGGGLVFVGVEGVIGEIEGKFFVKFFHC